MWFSFDVKTKMQFNEEILQHTDSRTMQTDESSFVSLQTLIMLKND